MPMCDCTCATPSPATPRPRWPGRRPRASSPQRHLTADQCGDVVVAVLARAVERGEGLPVLEVSRVHRVPFASLPKCSFCCRPAKASPPPSTGPAVDPRHCRFPDSTTRARGRPRRAHPPVPRRAGRGGRASGSAPRSAARSAATPCCAASPAPRPSRSTPACSSRRWATRRSRPRAAAAPTSRCDRLGPLGSRAPEGPHPAYRLSGGTSLPGLGTMRGVWRDPVASAIARSTACRRPAVGRLRRPRAGPHASAADRTVTVRVLQERDGRRTVVSHFNKATKGRSCAPCSSRGGRQHSRRVRAGARRAGVPGRDGAGPEGPAHASTSSSTS